jgi:hypothetical protein
LMDAWPSMVLSGGCFATVIVGLIFSTFATESDLALCHCGCFIAVGVFTSSPADAWPLVESALWSPL